MEGWMSMFNRGRPLLRRSVTALIVAAGACAAVATASMAGASTTPSSSRVGAVSDGVAPPQSAASGFRIRNLQARDKCIGITGGNAGLWRCTTNPDQRWEWSGHGAFRQLKNGNGDCLGISNGRINAGFCGVLSDQQWALGKAGPAGNYLESGLVTVPPTDWGVIGVQGGSNANGAPLVYTDPVGHADQYWTLG
jgi:Ricin-type beta-trefoil lectin domain